ncbi:MAG: S-layer homology domain-containing protein [Clostridiales bacterium]|nr:S-layer homology domain-containing protein [Clostridiales bacterium]
MKKTFISFIVALSIAVYSLCGFSVFADATPNEDTALPPGSALSGSTNLNQNTAPISTGNPQDVILRSFDGTNADGTVDASKGISTTLIENGSKYNGMASVALGTDMAQSRYSSTRVALSPDIADTKYAEAAELLGALGIMVGDAESGAFRPDDAILRSEMAKVAVYSIGLEDIVKSSNGTTKFPDVPSDHWATGAINVADQQGLVIGDSEGTFRPDDNVTFEEAVTIIVRALGYEPAAQDKGGYPSGYMSIASQKQLLKGIDAVSAQPAKRGDIAQLVFNAMTVNMMEQVGYGSTVSYQEVDKTLLYDRLNVEKAYGQITATDETSLTGGSVAGDGKVQINDELYLKGDTNANQLLGYNVLYYARIDKTYDQKTLILVTPQSNKNNSLVLNSTDIVDVTGTESANRTVEYWANRTTDRRTKTASIKSDATYIYNGKYKTGITNADLKPTSGNLVLLDANMDNIYEIVFVNHFTNLVVDTVSDVTGRVTDKYLNGSIVFDSNNPDVKYSIIKNGAEISIKDLREWNVISYTISDDQHLIKAYVSDASVTGTVNEISEEGYRIGESDIMYEKAASYPNEIKLLDKGTFYLDIEDKIAAVNTKATNESAITTNYAYLVDAAVKTDFDKTAQFKLFTKEGTTVVLDSASKMRINDKYAQAPSDVVAELTSGGGVTPQLIIYETNSSGNITGIETAKDGTATGAPNTAEFTKNIQRSDMVYKRESGKLGNVGVGDDTIIFDIPASAGDNTDKYTIRNKSTLSNDSSYDAIVYDLQDNYMANVIIITSSTGITNAESPITVVDYLAETQNAEMEYTDKLYGFSEGKEIELMAADKSVFKKSDGTALKAGDIIQYKTDAKGNVDGITLLFDSNNKTSEFMTAVTKDLTTVYGRAVKKFSGSVNVQVGDQTYNFATGDAIVYLYDSARKKNPISVVSAADIELYEKDNEARLFVKIYQDQVQEMVIVR